MAKIIAVFNIKGGVGKTTSAVNLAYLAAASGHRTLLWDMDHQGSAGFFLQQDDGLKGGLKWLVKDMEQSADKRQVAVKVVPTAYKNLDLLPSDMSMRLLDVKAAEAKSPGQFIGKFLQPFREQYDYIIVDCPPGLSAANESLLHCASLVLVPVIPTVLSVRTLEQLRDHIKEHIPEGPKLRAFFTLMDARKNLHKEIYEQLCVKRKTIILPVAVPYASIAEKMALHKAPLETFAASSRPAQAYRELWESLSRMRL